MASLCQSTVIPFLPSNRCSTTTVMAASPLFRPSQWMMKKKIQTSMKRSSHVVCMAPEDEKMTRRSPLEFPVEWEQSRSGRRPDVIPQFTPMKTPLPPPLPADPPQEDEEEEKKKEEGEEEEEEEEKPEDPDKPGES